MVPNPTPGTLFKGLDKQSGNYQLALAITPDQAQRLANEGSGNQFAYQDDYTGMYYLTRDLVAFGGSNTAQRLWDDMITARNARVAQIVPTLTGRRLFEPPRPPAQLDHDDYIFEGFYEFEPAGWDRQAWGRFNNFYDHRYDYRVNPGRPPNYRDFIANANWVHGSVYDTAFNRPWSYDAEIAAAKQAIDNEYVAAIAEYNALYGTHLVPAPDMLGPNGPITKYQASLPAEHRGSGGFFANAPGFGIILSAVTGAILSDFLMTAVEGAAMPVSVAENLAVQAGDFIDVVQGAATMPASVATDLAVQAGDFIDIVQGGAIATESVASAADGLVEAVQQGGAALTADPAAIQRAADTIIDGIYNGGAPIQQIQDFADKFIDAVQAAPTTATTNAANSLTDALRSMSNLVPSNGTISASSPGLLQSVTQGLAASDVLAKAGLAAAATAGTALVSSLFKQATGQTLARNPVTGLPILPGINTPYNTAYNTGSSTTGLLAIAGLALALLGGS